MKTRLLNLFSLFAVVASLVLGGASSIGTRAQPMALVPDSAQVKAVLQSGPLMFVENVGLSDPAARFRVGGIPQATGAALSTGATTRVSVASDGTQGDADSWYQSISANGRYVAFYSEASNLVSGDTNGYGDVFVHDLLTQQTERVSVASDGTQGNEVSWGPSISADGRYVAFNSKASNLVSGDTNGEQDVFIHDRQTGQTERVSVASDGTQGNGVSYHPAISADGCHVAFVSWASNLVIGDANGEEDVFVHDRETMQTIRVSAASDGSQGNSTSGGYWWHGLSISADGRYVAFTSWASNLVSGDTNECVMYTNGHCPDIFVHDLQTQLTERVSVATDGTQGNRHSRYPSISADGRYVAFQSWASNLVGSDTNGHGDVFVHDLLTQQTERVSVASDGTQGNDNSEYPSISADGRYVAFTSNASNLVPGDSNSYCDTDFDGVFDDNCPDILVHNRQTGQTERVSVATDGTQGNDISRLYPSISADGRYVAFESSASNLVPGDTNGSMDVFVHDRRGAVGGGPGSPTLLAASHIPTSSSLVATAQVRNTGACAQQFTLAVRLREGSTALSTQTFTLVLPAGATGDQAADFGPRPAGRYRVEAVLSAGGTTLATESRDVIVADPSVSQILRYGRSLRKFAHAELDEIAHVPSYALADEIVSLGLDELEKYAVGRFADLAAPIQDAGGIPRSWSNDAIDQIRDKLGRARGHRQQLAAAIRLLVRESHGVTLPVGFDPLNPDLEFITDPILKERIQDAIARFVADVFDDLIISPLWVNAPRNEVDVRHAAFEDFVVSQAVAEPPGLAMQMKHGWDRIADVVEGDAIVTLGPYNILGHTLRYDLTLREQENKRQEIKEASRIVKIALAALTAVGVVIILMLIVGAISSGGTLAAVAAPVIWKIVRILHTVSKILPFATALLVVSMLFTVPEIAPHVPQYQDETLDAAETLIGGTGQARLRFFNVVVQPGQARLTTQVDGPETGQSQALVETALYSVDGRITNIVWSPLQIEAGQQATLSKDVPLTPGTYRAVTILYTEKDVTAAPVVPLQAPGPGIEMSLWLDQARLSPGEALQAHVLITNTDSISDVNDLTLVLESTDSANFDAWPVSLAAGTTQQIDHIFTPTTGAHVLRAWLGIGFNTLAQQDAAYVVGSGPAIAINTSVSDVYTPGLTMTLPLTVTNAGDAPGAVTVTVQIVDRLQAGVVVYSSTLTATVPADDTVFAQATALPNAQPGLYSVWLDVNGVLYDTRDFAVSAVDTLFGLLTLGDLYPSVGQSVPVTATVRSADNTPTDATITVTVQLPSGTLATLPMTWVSTGTYRADYSPVVSGTYSLELNVARSDYRGVGDQSFLVAGTPTLLIPTVEGQPRAGDFRLITITVSSEVDIPVPGVTVVLSGTEELLRGETDTVGQVVLQTFPPDGHPYVLTANKMGYAGATTEVAVEWFSVYIPLILRQSP